MGEVDLENDSLGKVLGRYRTSRVQAVVLFVMAGLMAGAAYFLFSIDDKQNLLPVELIVAGAAVFFLGWGAKLGFCVMEVREEGIVLGYLVRRVRVRFEEIEAMGLRQRTVNGLPGSYSGVWLKRRDGVVILFPLESNAREACERVQRAMAGGA